MAADQPGQTGPRSLQAEVQIDASSNRMDQPVPEQPVVEAPTQPDVTDNTVANQVDEAPNDRLSDPEPPTDQVTEREMNRVQRLANEKAQAEARAIQAENLLRNMVNAQLAQPKQSNEELLAKQFKTYDPTIGYPTDAKEYALFVQRNAEIRASEAAEAATKRIREQQDTADLLRYHPEIEQDIVLRGTVIAIKQENPTLSYVQAAELAKKQLGQKVTASASARVAQDTQEKNEAYVETTRGASPSRTAAPSPEKMSLKEMEAFLRENGEW